MELTNDVIDDVGAAQTRFPHKIWQTRFYGSQVRTALQPRQRGKRADGELDDCMREMNLVSAVFPDVVQASCAGRVLSSRFHKDTVLIAVVAAIPAGAPWRAHRHTIVEHDRWLLFDTMEEAET